MTANPLLQDFDLPPFAAIEAEHVLPALESTLGGYQSAVDAVVADTGPATWASVMAPLEHWDDLLERIWSPVSHLHNVADTPALREAYNAGLERITAFETELGQNRALFERVQALADGPGFGLLSPPQQKQVQDSLRDFRLSGVSLEAEPRARVKAIAESLAKLSSAFEEAVLDATEDWFLEVPEARLTGLPESARDTLAGYSRAAGGDGFRVTLHQPSVQAVLTYAEDRSLRAEVYQAFQTRASDQGPQAGRYDNSARMAEILDLRLELARLLGFDNPCALSLATKMAPSEARVLGFLRELAARARPVAERERDELAAYAASELGIPDLSPWDLAFASERLREARFGLKEEDLKPYFPLPSAIRGLLEIASELFGVAFQEAIEGLPVWHQDVRYYRVLDGNGAEIAGFYLDLYARKGKRGGAWMDVCRGRFHGPAGLRTPVAYLSCNFAPHTEQRPSLLSHDDVLTLFHEFGHGLHHMLTEVEVPGLAGISGVEWDAVELPSQFLENFAWQRQTLDRFARHYQSGETLPEALHSRMLAARHFQAGLFLVRQLEFALFDFRLHAEHDPARGATVMATLESVRDEVTVIRPPDWQRFPHAFTHIFGGGYAAGYYSYLWAEVLSADAFSRFEEEGLLNPETGAAFRREILAMGGARPALESFRAFRGRDPEPEALLRSYGLAA